MGKLHTLRRAIQEAPTVWFFTTYNDRVQIAYGARFTGTKWHPQKWGWNRHSYESFVASVLRDLGYKKATISRKSGRRSYR